MEDVREPALAQLRQGKVDGPDQGVPAPGPVAIAGVGPLRAKGAVVGTIGGIGIHAHQHLHEGPQQLAQQVRLGGLRVLGHHLGKVNGHRDLLLKGVFW